MSDTPAKSPNRAREIAAYLDGTLDSAAMPNFCDWLNASDTNARQLVEQMLLESHLRRPTSAPALHADAKPAPGEASGTSPLSAAGAPIYRKGYEPKPATGNPRRALVFAVAAAVIAACGVAIYLLAFAAAPSETEPRTSNIEHPPVATLIQNTGDLRTPHGYPAEGDDYSAGEYTLTSGKAEFMLTNAINVKLHGDTRLHMHNNMNVALTRGSAAFVVPDNAKGFTVHLPDRSKIVDHGTAFRVHLDDRGFTNITVTEGRVVATHDATGREFELTADQWARFTDNVDAPVQRFTGAALLDTNLVVNGDFEDGPHNAIDAEKPTDIAIAGWVDTNAATVVTYGFRTDAGYPNPTTEPVPDDRSDRYFIGAVAGSTHQDIDVRPLGEAIDAGLIRADLSAWLGGFSGQNDSASVVARFYNAADEEITSTSIGPVTASDRAAKFGHRPDGIPMTGFIETKNEIECPPLTRRVRIELITHPGHGLIDAYVDNIELTLRLNTESTDTNPPSSPPEETTGAIDTR